jgi:hypothetical protein
VKIYQNRKSLLLLICLLTIGIIVVTLLFSQKNDLDTIHRIEIKSYNFTLSPEYRSISHTIIDSENFQRIETDQFNNEILNFSIRISIKQFDYIVEGYKLFENSADQIINNDDCDGGSTLEIQAYDSKQFKLASHQIYLCGNEQNKVDILIKRVNDIESELMD